jgi:hypothetical protein
MNLEEADHRGRVMAQAMYSELEKIAKAPKVAPGSVRNYTKMLQSANAADARAADYAKGVGYDPKSIGSRLRGLDPAWESAEGKTYKSLKARAEGQRAHGLENQKKRKADLEARVQAGAHGQKGALDELKTIADTKTQERRYWPLPPKKVDPTTPTTGGGTDPKKPDEPLMSAGAKKALVGTAGVLGVGGAAVAGKRYLDQQNRQGQHPPGGRAY